MIGVTELLSQEELYSNEERLTKLEKDFLDLVIELEYLKSELANKVDK